ncbi:MAG TPA: tyrosine--tRNA ligase, partial [Ktedonobacteraceae bacterium]|nr:tyrosine--tRNA ligase [Ktedonobacteraceae bacterium]
NLLVGRELQPIFGQPSQQILTVPLIVGLDGVKKMGKSLQNFIAINAPANDMFGKLMSLPDHAMMSYFETLTDVPLEELAEMRVKMEDGSLNPVVVKRRMAREIVAAFHNADLAAGSEQAFTRQFSERQLPVDMPEHQLGEPVSLVQLMVDLKLVPSRNEARRRIQQGGVTFYPEGDINHAERITDVEYMLPVLDGAVLKVGKLSYLKLRKA